MEALKANYHKILFLVALGVFGWSAFSVFTKIKNLEVPDAGDPAPKSATAVTQEVYEAMVKLLGERWQAPPSDARTLVSEERFLCPGTNCHRLVTYDRSVENIECPFCGYEVNPDPPDRDYDGMSNEYEEVHGLDPNRDDAEEDLDGDSFWNIVEHDAGTHPNDPTNHPPYTPFLYVTNLVNDRVNIVFHNANKIGPDQYLFQLMNPRNRVVRTVKIGDDLGPYKVLEYERNVIPAHNEKDARGNVVFVPQKDESVLRILHKEKNRTIDLIKGRLGSGDDWSGEIRSTIDSNYVARIDAFVNKKLSFRSESYEVKEITDREVVVLDLQRDNEELVIGRQPELLDPNTRQAPSIDFGEGGEFGFPDLEGMDPRDPRYQRMMEEYYRQFENPELGPQGLPPPPSRRGPRRR